MPLIRSVDDTEYASWPILAPAGVDVSGDTAKIAFTLKRWDVPTTWWPAEIVTDAVRYGDSRPRIRILIGPENGGVQPGIGTWYVHGKIYDSPEVPSKYLDVLILR